MKCMRDPFQINRELSIFGLSGTHLYMFWGVDDKHTDGMILDTIPYGLHANNGFLSSLKASSVADTKRSERSQITDVLVPLHLVPQLNQLTSATNLDPGQGTWQAVDFFQFDCVRWDFFSEVPNNLLSGVVVQLDRNLIFQFLSQISLAQTWNHRKAINLGRGNKGSKNKWKNLETANCEFTSFSAEEQNKGACQRAGRAACSGVGGGVEGGDDDNHNDSDSKVHHMTATTEICC